MAYENGLLNPGLAASSMSLARRSNTSLNTISNALYSEADTNSLYNTLQRDTHIAATPRLRPKAPVYNNVKPGAHLQTKQEKAATSQQTLQQKQSVKRRDKIIRMTVMCLILFVASAALLLALLLMMGKIGPDCPCNSSGTTSPSTGQQRTEENSSQQNQTTTFAMNLSPYYDIIEELQNNLSSLHAEAESLLRDSKRNKDNLVVTRTEFNSTTDAIKSFSDRFYGVVDQVNNTVQQFNPDQGPMFTQLDALNATLTNKMSEVKRSLEQHDNAIDAAIATMNNTIREKVKAKISLPGPVGERGRNGSIGPKGDPGQIGQTGPPGDSGSSGFPGDKGNPGVNGFPGTNGIKGLRGDTGAVGPPGDDGPTGAEGPGGPAGPRGIGNFSWCQEKTVSVALTDIPGKKASVSDSQGTKILAATCSTDYGQEYNLVATKGNFNTYECVCRGAIAGKVASDVNCILYYWACPIQAP